MGPLDRFLYHQAFFIGELCVLPILAVLLRYNWNQRAKAERSAGKLVLKVVRPRVKVWKTLRAGVLLDDHLRPGRVLRFSRLPAQVHFGRGTVEKRDELRRPVDGRRRLLGAWGDAFLELREHGAVCGATYFPWETIREWTWSDRHSTLRLKSSHSVASFRLDPRDMEAVQRVLVAQPTLRMSDHR